MMEVPPQKPGSEPLQAVVLWADLQAPSELLQAWFFYRTTPSCNTGVYTAPKKGDARPI